MTDKEHKIHIIATGGTIDSKFHPPKEGSLVKDKSGITDYLDNIIKPHFSYDFDTVSMVDSSDITKEIRDKIVTIIKQSQLQNFLITHGTNTMPQTLEHLHSQLGNTDKTIVLTGAMIPLEGFSPTDAGFNLGYAIAQLQSLENGIFIAMHGQLFKAGEVQKNFDIARFEKIATA